MSWLFLFKAPKTRSKPCKSLTDAEYEEIFAAVLNQTVYGNETIIASKIIPVFVIKCQFEITC